MDQTHDALVLPDLPSSTICAMVKSRYVADGHPTFNDGNPYNGYINPYYLVDDHPLLYGNNGSLDPSTYGHFGGPIISCIWDVQRRMTLTSESLQRMSNFTYLHIPVSVTVASWSFSLTV